MAQASGVEPATVLFAHPSPDLYGSDRMLVESVTAVVERGHRAVVALPADGPLTGPLETAGARVVISPTLVLRKSLLRPRGLPTLLRDTARGAVAGLALLRRTGAGAVYVNTVTVPLWPLLGRLAGVPVLAHVHEAEHEVARALRVALAAPLLPADVVVVNSRATGRVLTAAIARLHGRLRLVYNGVAGPAANQVREPAATTPDPLRVVYVGRLSPRKGVEVAVRALAELRDRGLPATLDLVGAVFPGYEWFERRLHELAGELGVAGSVRFRGFASPVWERYAAADVAVVPSLSTEPFGNVSVEAQLAARPVVAARTQGLVETLDDGRTGVLVPAGDPVALADALAGLLADWPRAAAMGRAARTDARSRFAPARYRTEIADLVDGLLARPHHSRPAGARAAGPAGVRQDGDGEHGPPRRAGTGGHRERSLRARVPLRRRPGRDRLGPAT